VTETRSAHWNERYATVGANAVSWYQDRPATSLDLLQAAGVGPTDSVIDIGGGASTLVDGLLLAGHTDLAVLDVSEVALGVARERVGADAPVDWLVEDLLTWEPDRTWDAWHDRAVLHFLLSDAERSRYVSTLRRALRPRGAVVIGTFAEDGPTTCSGLPVRRYAAEDLREVLGDIEVIEERRETHQTPSGGSQPFNWIAARLHDRG
jgi:SAM-dependent methyltransferase